MTRKKRPGIGNTLPEGIKDTQPINRDKLHGLLNPNPGNNAQPIDPDAIFELIGGEEEGNTVRTHFTEPTQPDESESLTQDELPAVSDTSNIIADAASIKPVRGKTLQSPTETTQQMPILSSDGKQVDILDDSELETVNLRPEPRIQRFAPTHLDLSAEETAALFAQADNESKKNPSANVFKRGLAPTLLDGESSPFDGPTLKTSKKTKRAIARTIDQDWASLDQMKNEIQFANTIQNGNKISRQSVKIDRGDKGFYLTVKSTNLGALRLDIKPDFNESSCKVEYIRQLSNNESHGQSKDLKEVSTNGGIIFIDKYPSGDDFPLQLILNANGQSVYIRNKSDDEVVFHGLMLDLGGGEKKMSHTKEDLKNLNSANKTPAVEPLKLDLGAIRYLKETAKTTEDPDIASKIATYLEASSADLNQLPTDIQELLQDFINSSESNVTDTAQAVKVTKKEGFFSRLKRTFGIKS